MSAIEHLLPWAQQPQEAVRLAGWVGGTPLAVSVGAMAQPGPLLYAGTGAADAIPGPLGMAQASASTYAGPGNTQPLLPTGGAPCTVLALVETLSGAGGAGNTFVFSGLAGDDVGLLRGGYTWQYRLNNDYSGPTAQQPYDADGAHAWPAPGRRWLIVGRSLSTTDHRITACELNGKGRRSDGSASTSTAGLAFDEWGTVTLGRAGHDLLYYGALISGWAIDDRQIELLRANPWSLFEPRRIWVPVAAGGGAAADLATTGNSGTFSGTANSPATATLAATGASGALSASAGTSASAALAATGDSGTLSASAYTPALASLAATGGSGIFVGSAFSEATAALSATGGSGTLSASAGAEASASLAATGGSGTLAADAFVQAVATLAATGVSGSLIASAWTTISATLSATGGSGELTASAGEPVVATRVLSSYRPLPPPADPKDVGRWAMNELLTIARHLADGRDFDLLNTIHAQPSKPREGMVVHADGTNWDPGSGAGRYERVGGAWVKL